MPELYVVVQVIGAMGIGGIVFFGAALVLGVDEAEIVPRLAMRKLRR